MSRGGQQSCDGSGAEVLWGAAEGTGMDQAGEQLLRGTLWFSPTAWKEAVARWESALLPGNSSRP